MSRARFAVGAILVLVLGVGAGGIAGSPAAHAAPAGCVTDTDNSLTIIQTSVIENLGPHLPAAEISGTVTNNSDDETYIHAIVVTIAGFARGADAVTGCDATDFVIAPSRMPVERELQPHETISFGGSTIGFLNQPHNQDACKNLTITLSYEVAG